VKRGPLFVFGCEFGSVGGFAGDEGGAVCAGCGEACHETR